MLECDLRLYQQTHSHCDEEYLSLLRHRQQLQKVPLHIFRLHVMYDNLCVCMLSSQFQIYNDNG